MRIQRLSILSGILALAPMARAVTVYGPQGRNTSAPTGTLSTAGWQWEGQFGIFLGTAISSQFFITAQHIGSSSAFILNGTSYPIDTTYNGGLGYTNIAGTDLRVWKVNGTLPTYAPLYGGGSLTFGSEVGKNMLVVGRGVARGEPVTLADARLYSGDGTAALAQAGALPASSVADSGATDLKGWFWGNADHAESWGINTVAGTATDPTLGHFITFQFTDTGGPNEGGLANEDSGGGLFVDATGNGDWRLAGINYGVDYPFSGSATGASFGATLFDMGGLWLDETNPPQYIADESEDVPQTSYDSSISGNYAAIEAIIGSGADIPIVPEPGSAAILVGCLAIGSRRSRRLGTTG